MKRYILGISGASGSAYALALLDRLARLDETQIHLIITENGSRVLEHECGVKTGQLLTRPGQARAGNIILHDNQDMFAPPASGSFKFEAMIVLPCSMGSLSQIACGASRNLLCRAADVALKEGRRLILVPRESPYSALHLENMLKLSRAGVCILPASPGFYHRPTSLEDCYAFIADRVLAQLGLESDCEEWGIS